MKFAAQTHPKRMTPAQLRMHLKMLHGVHTTGIETVASLHQCHGLDHNDPDPLYYREHEHESWKRDG